MDFEDRLKKIEEQRRSTEVRDEKARRTSSARRDELMRSEIVELTSAFASAAAVLRKRESKGSPMFSNVRTEGRFRRRLNATYSGKCWRFSDQLYLREDGALFGDGVHIVGNTEVLDSSLQAELQKQSWAIKPGQMYILTDRKPLRLGPGNIEVSPQEGWRVTPSVRQIEPRIETDIDVDNWGHLWGSRRSTRFRHGHEITKTVGEVIANWTADILGK